MNSRVAGEMKESLAFWHLGRIFETEPQLNEDFVTCVPRDDIFAVTDVGTDKVFAHIFNKIKVLRKLPKYGTPQL